MCRYSCQDNMKDICYDCESKNEDSQVKHNSKEH